MRGEVAMTEVADGAVLLDEATGTFYHLNATGAFAFALLRSGEHTVAEVAQAVASAFGTDGVATLADVRSFADDLVRARLVRPWA